MDSQPTAADVLRKVLFLALFGFLAVILAGPVIAVCSVLLSVLLTAGLVLLPFVLIGFVVWLPFQALVLGRRIEWRRVGASVQALYTGLFSVVGGVFGSGFRLVKGVARRIGTAVLFLMSVALDVLGGALVGAVLGALGGLWHDDAPGRIPMGALVGAAVGFIVALTRSREPKKANEKVVEAQVVMPVKPRQIFGLKGCVEVPVR